MVMTNRFQGIMSIIQLLICATSIYIASFNSAGKSYIVGSNSNRFLTRLFVIILVFGGFMLHLVGYHTYALGHVIVKVEWMITMLMGFLIFVTYEEIEEEMKNEGVRVYNNRIPHDEYTVW